MRRRVALLGAVAVGISVLSAGAGQTAAPSLATVAVSVGTSIRPPGGTTGQCSAEMARPDTNGETMSVLVTGTAQSVGAVASTGISCTIYQDPDFNLVYDTPRGGCGAALPLNAAVCTRLVAGVPIAPFKICAVSTAHLLSGHVVSGQGPGCPDFLD
jgi:hypothetical protein